jgi:hypothetical protein
VISSERQHDQADFDAFEVEWEVWMSGDDGDDEVERPCRTSWCDTMTRGPWCNRCTQAYLAVSAAKIAHQDLAQTRGPVSPWHRAGANPKTS